MEKNTFSSGLLFCLNDFVRNPATREPTHIKVERTQLEGGIVQLATRGSWHRY